ncbi:hypothetical protein DPMN_119247 [Dreissena polymorpha]|uniref:Uncharacterized protein n=1 Tax=Dreissena polymorpha TaxID=45954 RepID=A0A9D4GIX8_DREPO|nr:hypothetical protein DPMN_119247 [Dreissena polymorpha]
MPRPTGDHVFQRTGTTFELNQHIIKANILTKFHENLAKYVTSRVFTCFHYIHIEKCPAHWRPYINKTNVLSNFHDDWTNIVTSRVFTRENCHYTIFELVRDINKTNVLTNFHDGWAKIVTSRVLTRFLYSQIMKTAPPTGGHANILTNFELDRDLIGTKLLTKFHEDRTRNVAYRVFTNGRTTDKGQSQKS